MKYIFMLIFFSLNILEANFIGINEKEFIKMQKDGVVVIDIRRENEFKKLGIIKNSHTLTFFDENNKYDIPKWMNKFVRIVKTKEQPFIIYCAHANRTKTLGDFLSTTLKYKNVYDLKGGIAYGWIDKGQKTVPYKQKN